MTPDIAVISIERRPGSLPWWQGWGPLLVLPVALWLFLPVEWPPWAKMWSLAFVIYCGCKWLTWRRTSNRGATIGRQIGYLLAWPGLDAAAFLRPSDARPVPRPGIGEWFFTAAKLAIGLFLLFAVVRFLPIGSPYLIGWVGMVGIVMVLHFGVFHLLSCAWRQRGVDAKPLMNWPLASTSVSDFWGRRWNTAFRDLTHRFLFRPLTARLGARGALFGGFLFSGLVHDLVISVPSGGGYGGPTIFFVWQGLAMLIERSDRGKRLGLGTGWRGWLFTAVSLLVPAPLLFHVPFVTGIIIPFLRVSGAL